MKTTPTVRGFLYAIGAYVIWGTLPLYWRLLIAFDSRHLLAFRILFSLILVSVILTAQKNFTWLTVFRERKKRYFLILTGMLICVNWGLFIWAVNSGKTLSTSLGYYITPLVSICLGLLFFRERLKPLQWAAVAFALTGVLLLTILTGRLPWVSLMLAVTFGIYGMLKKKLAIPALESLGSETIVSVPLSVLLLCFSFDGAKPVFTGFSGLSYLSDIPVYTWFILSASGVASILPLYLFAQAAKRLPLSALGFSQFLAPTISFMLGVFVFGEIFPFHNMLSFIFIWTAVILYIVSLRPKH